MNRSHLKETSKQHHPEGATLELSGQEKEGHPRNSWRRAGESGACTPVEHARIGEQMWSMA